MLKWKKCSNEELASVIVYFQFFEIWDIKVTAKWIFRLLKYLTHFTKLFQELFCLLAHFLGNGLGWLLWESLRSVWRSLFLTVWRREVPWCNRDSTMLKDFLLGFCTGFSQCLHNQYVSIFHTGHTKLPGQFL